MRCRAGLCGRIRSRWRRTGAEPAGAAPSRPPLTRRMRAAWRDRLQTELDSLAETAFLSMSRDICSRRLSPNPGGQPSRGATALSADGRMAEPFESGPAPVGPAMIPREQTPKPGNLFRSNA